MSVRKPRCRFFGSEEDVSRNRQIRRDSQFLVDDPDARRPRLMRRMEMHRLSIQGDLASIRALCSRQDFHQGALTRTVLSNQSVDLPWPYREIHALERTHAGETLGYPAYGQDRLSRCDYLVQPWYSLTLSRVISLVGMRIVSSAAFCPP